MTMNPRDKNTKEEINPNFNKLQVSSSRQWTNNKNPRIVRASRTFGGKDRHSKVCTVRGLRDRRIRLSVPTAIQLYDLQDRLGLSQPSKVVDWLIEATKHEIDKLPPLPMLPQFQDPLQESVSNVNAPYSLSHFFPPFAAKDLGLMNQEKEGTKEQENQGFGGFVAQNLFPVSNIQPSFVPNVTYNNPYNFHWDPPSLSLSRFGEGYSFSDQDPHHQTSSSHLYFAQTEAANMVPSIIPQFPASYNMGENIGMRSSQIYNPSVTPTTLHLISSPMRSRTVQSPENNYRREESEKGNRHS